MFGIQELRKRVKALEDKSDRREQRENCSNGKHEWEMCIHSKDDVPHVRCKHCLFHPNDSK